MSAKKYPPENAASIVQEMSSRGCLQRSISKALGVSYEVWQRWKEEYQEIEEALQQGRAVEHDILVNVLMKAATEQKSVTAAIFLLKTRHGYRENESLDQGPKVQINFELPGAVDPKTYEAEILQKAATEGRKGKKGIAND